MANLKILITGPESSGKSTLATALANSLDGSLVKEQARAYLEDKSGSYVENDLLKIAQKQHNAELKASGKIVVCDTGLEVIKIWSEEKYGRCHDWIEERLKSSQYDLVFLCSPEIPWEPDPLRDNPADRDRLFKLYKNLLASLSWSFMVLAGTKQQRHQKALNLIQTRL